MTEMYAAALLAIRLADREFAAVRDDYRARRIGDNAFLAAREKYRAASARFDIAFAQEAALGDDELSPASKKD